MATCLTPYIKALYVSPPTLTPSGLAEALRLIFQKKPSEIQILAFLTALALRKLDRDPHMILAAVRTTLEFSEVPVIDPALFSRHVFTDIVGTGGDGQNTFNVSTLLAIVVAGIPGNVVVTKHGGKASTSLSGAGDLVSHLGVDTSKINASSVPELVEKNKFVFLFAPTFHDGMKQVAHVRKQLGIPSIFNILGPLLNPVPLQSRVLGVYAEELGPVYALAVKDLLKNSPSRANSQNKYSTVVVWGEVGLDELSPIGRSKIWYLEPGTGDIKLEYLTPNDFGLPEHLLEEVQSGTAEENAALLKAILLGDLDSSPAIVDYILMNSALLAVSCGLAQDFKEGVRLARESIVSGRAKLALDQLVKSV